MAAEPRRPERKAQTPSPPKKVQAGDSVVAGQEDTFVSEDIKVSETGQVGSDLDATFVPSTAATQATVQAGAVAAPKPSPAAGDLTSRQFGDFRIERKLGKGGMGIVYLATQLSLDRKVALKTLSKELAEKPDFVKRFLREARSMARLQHQNIVQVYAADSADGMHYAAIEFIDGKSLQDWMNEKKQLSVGDAFYVTLVCADALRHAHELNMIHRDIKPDNILVTKKGVVKVADFGLAKAMDEDVSMTQSGTGLGTPLYMAPEQARNAKHVDQRSDIYALGATLYYFVTGKFPFTGESTLELITAKEKGQYTSPRRLNPAVTERLDIIIGKMMAKDPQHRYATCAEVIRDLQGLGQANASLSFIEGGESSLVAAVAGTAASQARTKVAAQTKVPVKAPHEAPAGPADKVWLVLHKNPKGRLEQSKLTTSQIQKFIRNNVFDLTTKAKSSQKGPFLPLAQYPEFEKSTRGLALQQKANERSQDVRTIYDKLDRAERRRKKWRFLKNIVEGAKGGVSLLIWLAIVCGGLFAAWKYGWPLLKQFLDR